MQKIRGYVVFIRIKTTIQVFSRRSSRVSQSFGTCQQIVRRSTNNRMSFDKRLSDVRRTMTEVLMDADLHVAERLLPRLVLLIFAKGTVPAHVCIDGLVKAEHLLDHPWTHLKAIACGNLS